MLLGVFTSNGDIILPFIFLYGLKLDTKVYIKSLEEIVLPGLRRWLLEDPTSGNRTLSHVTLVGETSFGCEKISATASLLTSGFLTPVCNPLDYYVCGGHD